MPGSKNKIIILVFHGITGITSVSTGAWIPSLKRTTPAGLESCLDILTRNNCQFISIPEAVEIINKRLPMKKNCVCLTFDDGFRNQLSRALPIVEKYKAPSTFFIVTDPVENQVPYWFDRADYAIQHLSLEQLELAIGAEKFMIRAKNRNEMADSLDDDVAFDELRNSRLALQSKTGVACDCLALPSGLFNESTFELIKKAGYKSAVTSINGVNSYNSDVYKLKRINVPAGQSAEELLKRVIEAKIETYAHHVQSTEQSRLCWNLKTKTLANELN